HSVDAFAGLRGHGPHLAVESDLASGCDLKGLQFSHVHRPVSRTKPLSSAGLSLAKKTPTLQVGSCFARITLAIISSCRDRARTLKTAKTTICAYRSRTRNARLLSRRANWKNWIWPRGRARSCWTRPGVASKGLVKPVENRHNEKCRRGGS